MKRFVISTALLLASVSCAARTSAPAAVTAGNATAHENLNAVLWLQTAIEFEAAAVQAYRLAQLQLDAALSDPSWTAALEQQGDASKLPPAVVVDIDETVLDNSYYQARLIRDNAVYATPSWDAWVAGARADCCSGRGRVQQVPRQVRASPFFTSLTGRRTWRKRLERTWRRWDFRYRMASTRCWCGENSPSGLRPPKARDELSSLPTIESSC